MTHRVARTGLFTRVFLENGAKVFLVASSDVIGTIFELRRPKEQDFLVQFRDVRKGIDRRSHAEFTGDAHSRSTQARVKMSKCEFALELY